MLHLLEVDSSEEDNFNSCRDDSDSECKFVNSNEGDISEDDMDTSLLPERGRGQAREHGGICGGVRLDVCIRERGSVGYGRGWGGQSRGSTGVPIFEPLGGTDNADLVLNFNPDGVSMQRPADFSPPVSLISSNLLLRTAGMQSLQATFPRHQLLVWLCGRRYLNLEPSMNIFF